MFIKHIEVWKPYLGFKSVTELLKYCQERKEFWQPSGVEPSADDVSIMLQIELNYRRSFHYLPPTARACLIYPRILALLLNQLKPEEQEEVKKMNPWSVKKCEDITVTLKMETCREVSLMAERASPEQSEWLDDQMLSEPLDDQTLLPINAHWHPDLLQRVSKTPLMEAAKHFCEDVDKAISCFAFPLHWPDMARLELPTNCHNLTMGWHPMMAALDNDWWMRQFRELLSWKGVCALGEVGLDYFQSPLKGQQKELFRKMVDLAIEFNLLLMLHLRDHEDKESAALEILQAKFHKYH